MNSHIGEDLTLPSERIPRCEALARLPPVWPEDPLPAIRGALRGRPHKIVVLDDDPTGTQTVREVAVLTEWSVGALLREFAAPPPLFYILTNSRALPPAAARELMREIAAHLRAAAAAEGCTFTVINRGDSTLRGHFPDELDALAEALGLRRAPWILAPAFEAGGRLTLGDVHYVSEGEALVPAGETPFARDATFGYRSSNLRAWVEEKTAGRIKAADVVSVSIERLRVGGPAAVQRLLAGLGPGAVCVVNAAVRRDLEVFALGWLHAEAAGGAFLCRSAASLVAALAGLDVRAPLPGLEIDPADAPGGLVVVGSHVPKTTEQLQSLLQTHPELAAVELAVEALDSPTARENEIVRTRRLLERALAEGRGAVLFTSRRLARGEDGEASLRLAMSVSAAVSAVVAQLQVRPRFLIAKGGITSSEIATRALGVKRAVVAGQLVPGVPVWRLGPESRWPGLPYVVFPGNVGDRDALAAAWARAGQSPAPLAAAGAGI